MNILVVSDAHLIEEQGKKVAYALYVKEMDIWMSMVEKTVFVCPNTYKGNLMAKPFDIQDFKQVGLRRLEFHKLYLLLFLFLRCLTKRLYSEWNAQADHAHIRCPGNLSLLGCFVQILFPRKRKTAKYAGNWDPNSKQPLSYRMQKWLLSNTLLTKNIQVLVYGEWESLTKNIKPFFTASYVDSEKVDVSPKEFKQPLRALFVGTMGANKRPFETVQLIHSLRRMGVDITLEMYGDGPEKKRIETYCKQYEIEDHIRLLGNQPSQVVKEAYKNAHIIILLSKSEGWPKVIAEAMFWGIVPITSKVSCVPWMSDNGNEVF